jgi:hypothetical protein
MLSIKDCRDILKYYHVSSPSNLHQLKEKTMELYHTRMCKSNLPFLYFFRRQSKNFRMTRKQRLGLYLV